MNRKITMAIREHPNEASAFVLGKRMYRRLAELGYNPRLEVCPLELTPLCFIKKGYFGGRIWRSPEYSNSRIEIWRRSFATDADSVVFSFHNADVATFGNEPAFCDITEYYPPHSEEGVKGKVIAIEIPAIYRNMTNPSILENGRNFSGSGSYGDAVFHQYVSTVVDVKACIKEGLLSEEIADTLTHDIIDLVNSHENAYL